MGALSQSQKSLRPWYFVWGAIFALNFILSLLVPESNFLTIVRLSGILLCLVYAAVASPRDRLLLVALFATCLSDFILAFDNTSVIGLIFFFATQVVHLFRLAGPECRRFVVVFASFAALSIGLNYLTALISPLYLVAGLYAMTLCLNIFASYRRLRRSPDQTLSHRRARYGFVGFLLFACCDFCTAISYLSLVAFLPAACYAPANFFAWLFYYPSQVLISNSGNPTSENGSRCH